MSIVLSRRGRAQRLFASLESGRVTLVTSEPVFAETAAVLARPRLVRTSEARELAGRVLDETRARADFIVIPGYLAVCRDPNDDMVIETALLGRADVLVSDDNDILRDPAVDDLVSDAGVRVLTVAQSWRSSTSPPTEGSEAPARPERDRPRV